MSTRQQHWDTTYASKPETGVSWFQSDPHRSLRWIKQAAPDHSAAIIDIGGGASRLSHAGDSSVPIRLTMASTTNASAASKTMLRRSTVSDFSREPVCANVELNCGVKR